MNAPLRKAGVVVMVLFGLLFANLNWVQAYRADDYRNDEHNGRVQVDEYKRPRGVIEAEGEALAQSQATVGRLKYQRVYPRKEQYAHVLGYKPVNGAATGIEAAENDFLAGTSDNLFADRISDLFTGDKTSGGNVQLTLKLRAQEAAYKNLTENEIGVEKGAAIAIDPRTGAVQAMVSVPSFDPNQLVSHDTAAVSKAYKQLTPAKGDDGPLLNRAVAKRLPPGSTFKIVVAAAALENGITQQTNIPAGSTYTAPTSGSPIKNAASSICPESEVTLLEAVTESCNTGFAQLGVSLGFAMLAVYAGIRIFDKLTTGIDEMEELKKGNVAVGILMGAVIIAYATVIAGGVRALTSVVLGLAGKSIIETAVALVGGLINLLIGLALASFAISMALKIFGKITKGMDEQQELKNRNVAVAFLLAAVLFATATVIAEGVGSVGTAISNLGAARF